MKKYSHLLFAAGLLASTPVQADVLYLQNGDRLRGSVLNATNAQSLSFRTGYGETINVPWTHVDRVYDSNYNRISTPGRPSAFAAPLTGSSEPLPEETAIRVSEAPAKVASAAVPDAGKPKWSGRVNLGASIQTGNSEKDAINADASAKVKWKDVHRAGIKGEYNREKDAGTITEDNWKIDGNYDYFYTDQWFLNTTLGFEQDEIDLIDLRTTAGLGIGHQLFEQDDLNLKYILGLVYLRETFTNNSDSEDSLAARWNFDYDQKVWGDALQLFHDHELLVPTDETDAYLFDSKTGVRVPIKEGLVATAEIDFEWDNAPEPGVQEDDTKYSLKIGYEW